MVERVFDWSARLLFVVIGIILFALSLSLVVAGAWALIAGAAAGEVGIFNLMNSVGLVIVSLAVLDLGKFVIEENVVRERELRSPVEALFSLTKFMTIIIIALSLEAVVGIFEAGREKAFADLIYPSAVMVTAVLALVGLGAFQLLSRRAQHETGGRQDAEPVDRES